MMGEWPKWLDSKSGFVLAAWYFDGTNELGAYASRRYVNISTDRAQQDFIEFLSVNHNTGKVQILGITLDQDDADMIIQNHADHEYQEWLAWRG